MNTPHAKKILSVVIPLLNEERNIPLLYQTLIAVMRTEPQYRVEYIFVDDGSSDSSAAAIDALAQKDSNVRSVEFSRNFGKEMATTAGLKEAKGDCVVMLDADLQHPPEKIPEMLRLWEEGAEVVIGVRTANHDEGVIKRYGSKLFYSIMSRISEVELIYGETDFRLLDRAVVDVFNTFAQRRRMTRALINWLGFHHKNIHFQSPARKHGNAAYSTTKLIRLALHSFVSNSLLPLRLTGYLGMLISALSGTLGVVVIFERYIFHDSLGWAISGPAQLAILNVFLVGVVLMSLGIIALYIENIDQEVIGRPLYVIRKKR